MARIVVADDSSMARTMAKRLLEKAGHGVSEAADGEAALALVRSESADVLLLDLNMPGLSGEETLRRMREDPALSGVRVIVLSADYLDEGKKAGLGADGYVVKSFGLSGLLEAIG